MVVYDALKSAEEVVEKEIKKEIDGGDGDDGVERDAYVYTAEEKRFGLGKARIEPLPLDFGAVCKLALHMVTSF
jgi:hypothetical protein